ncbi:M28 family metallopeptidase [Lutimonas zeaxanthinifaciens]|uniref:M28 family metallopeptidase n=1 Tax=Lutimonas zeaxanthinifaciens TaxID=3060215 RepID=UPI00265CE1F3|nr:M28 family peptidase [Lutimonas sp. YSD2104]WKK65722.1 M28 family peptidase [Lutimonas sp. YSD2104]
MEKSSKLLVLMFLVGMLNFSISAQMSQIKSTIDQIEAESHLRFLSADELRGRNTGTIELNIAGRYIAEQFRKYGLNPLGDEEGEYNQKVEIYESKPPSVASASLHDMVFDIKSDLGYINGKNGEIEGPVIFLEDPSEMETAELKGKIVVTVLGDIRKAVMHTDQIHKMEEMGAIGLIEIFGSGQQFPWDAVARYLNSQKMNLGKIDSVQGLPRVWVNDTTNVLSQKLKLNNTPTNARIQIDGLKKRSVDTYNIVGKIEGTDPALKDEHVIMCAHYDHIGVQSGKGLDSIYNGTRDNGIGTTGLINAAKYFSLYPAKRSIVIIALTAEEKGLLGSTYYSDNPKVPLEKTVFALNIDNSGYTDTENITLLDTARTNIDQFVYEAAKEAGLGVMGDRIPSQGYYERSDQVSFAKKGVPAVNFKMSMAAFDERISKYYHQPNDEFNTIDRDYIYKYWISYIRSAELISNWDQKPYWMPGDKFEEAGNKLYKKED